MSKLKVLELFDGLGACTESLKNTKIDFEVVDYVEIDKFAVKSYNAMNDTNYIPQDIKEWDKDIDVDFIMHGSPCTDYSIAGKQEGGNENSGTRSSLMWETVRIIEKLNPKFVMWENVKNVLSKKHKHNFDRYISRLNDLGYTSYYKVLNTKNYGLPQNRERVFCLSIKKELDNKGFEFPKGQELKLKLGSILEEEVDEKYYIKNERVNELINRVKNDKKGVFPTKENTITSALSSREHRGQGWKDISGTLCARDYKDPKVVCVSMPKESDCLQIRKLTPRECWRLQGFSDEQFKKAEKVNSNSQLYKQAGNSISVPVLEEIFKQMIKLKYM